MLIEEFYRQASYNPVYRKVLEQTDWFVANVRFDPLTGEAIPELLTDFLRKVGQYTLELPYRDRVAVILDGCDESLRRLMNSLNEEPRREHTDLPFWRARELDTTSFIELSRRNGRTLREKLAGRPKIKAVRHFLSIDTTENRLFKALVVRLCDLLELREKVSGKVDFESIRDLMFQWLRSDESAEIGRWDNQPPNNTLLGHRDYRRIWRAWTALQRLEDCLDHDIEAVDERSKLIDTWTMYANQYSDGGHVFADLPLLPDFENYKVKLLTPDGWSENVLPVSFDTPPRERTKDQLQQSQLVCVDPGYVQPRYAVAGKTGFLSDLFIQQYWHKYAPEVEVADFSLANSDCLCLDDDVVTITYPDVVYTDSLESASAEEQAEYSACRDSSAHAFARRLADIFRTPNLIWLSPDAKDDFSLEVVRKSFNARFASARPIPYSVAAVFDHVPYTSIKHDGYRVAVYEAFNKKVYRTLLIARYSPVLREAIPETFGYRWHKQVTEVVSKKTPKTKSDCGFYVWDGEDVPSRTYPTYETTFDNETDAKVRDADVDVAFFLKNSPVAGGLSLSELQQKAPDEPLWQNAIPELMIKAVRGNVLASIYLVDANTTVAPIPGRAVRLPIKDHFTLPAGKEFYRFRLYQGSKKEAIGYQMKLQSDRFPYPKDLECELVMTYTYGADNPFRLEFRPVEEKVKPIVASWHLLEEVVDAPAPDFPKAESWEELHHVLNPRTGRSNDICEWTYKSVMQLRESLNSPMLKGYPTCNWKEGSNGKYAFIEEDDTFENYWVKWDRSSSKVRNYLDQDETYYFSAVSMGNKKQAWWLSRSVEAYEGLKVSDLQRHVGKAMIFPFCRLWANNFSGLNSEREDVKSFIYSLQGAFVEIFRQSKGTKLGKLFKNPRHQAE